MPVHQSLCKVTADRVSPWGEDPGLEAKKDATKPASLGKLDVRGEGLPGPSHVTQVRSDEGIPLRSSDAVQTFWIGDDDSAPDSAVSGPIPGPEDEAPLVPSLSVMDAWQLPVRDAEAYRAIWTFRGESVASFLERARLEVLCPSCLQSACPGSAARWMLPHCCHVTSLVAEGRAVSHTRCGA